MNEFDYQPHQKESTSPKGELDIGGNVSGSIVIQGDGNKVHVVPSTPPVDEEKLKRLESQAIQFELKGNFHDARKNWYEIRRIDPSFPRVDVKIRELEYELRPKPKFAARPSWTSATAVFILLLLLLYIPFASGVNPAIPPPLVTEQPPLIEPSSQPSPAPTEAPVEQPPSSAEQFFTEEFDGDIENWSRLNVPGSKETNVDGLTLETNDSHLVYEFSTKQLYAYLFYEPFEYENVVVEASVENRGMNDNNVTLVCRYSDEGWYEFNIANSGLYNILYGFYKPDGEISYAFLADGESNKIKSGKDVNTYKIICRDRKLSLYINNTETRVLEDNNYALRNGKVGIGVSSFEQLPIKVEYDWVKVSEQ
jgi:hypothetical protein